MPRPGGGGGGHASGGGHSSGVHGGGHSFGGGSHGGSRPGAGSRPSGGGFGGGPHPGGGYGGFGGPHPHGGPGMPPPPPPRRHYRHYGGYGTGGFGCGGLGCGGLVIVIFIMICLLGFFGAVASDSGNRGSSSVSTIERSKLETSNSFINDCVVDEVGWVDNLSKTESELKEFWEDTGVQPYVILKEYDESLASEEAMEEWAISYYEENFDRNDIFLYVYFAAEDSDNDFGYNAYAMGSQVGSVMDSEAVEIFWNNLDEYWFGDYSMDQVIYLTFQSTGNTIMHVTTTSKDIFKWILIVIALVLVIILITRIIKDKNKRAKEKAAEDERILNTPINDLAEDDLTKKYLHDEDK